MRLHSLPYQQSGRFGSGTAAQASSGSSVASSAADRPVAGWFAAAATADLRRCPLSPSPAAGTAAAAAAGAAAAAAAGAAAAGSAPKSSRRVGEPLSTSRCPELTPLAAVRGGSLKSRRRRTRSPAAASADGDRGRLGVRCIVPRPRALQLLLLRTSPPRPSAQLFAEVFNSSDEFALASINDARHGHSLRLNGVVV